MSEGQELLFRSAGAHPFHWADSVSTRMGPECSNTGDPTWGEVRGTVSEVRGVPSRVKSDSASPLHATTHRCSRAELERMLWSPRAYGILKGWVQRAYTTTEPVVLSTSRAWCSHMSFRRSRCLGTDSWGVFLFLDLVFVRFFAMRTTTFFLHLYKIDE